MHAIAESPSESLPLNRTTLGATTEEVATYLRMPPGTVAYRRKTGKGPKGWIKVGKRQILPWAALAAYERELLERTADK